MHRYTALTPTQQGRIADMWSAHGHSSASCRTARCTAVPPVADVMTAVAAANVSAARKFHSHFVGPYGHDTVCPQHRVLATMVQISAHQLLMCWCPRGAACFGCDVEVGGF